MNNQYTLHLLPEPYLKMKTGSAKLYFPQIPIIGTFTGKEGDIWEIGKDFKFDVTAKFISGNYSNRCCKCGNIFYGTDKLWFLCKPCCDKKVAIPITQPVDDTHKIWSEVLQIYNAKGWSANELYKVLDSKFLVTRK